MHNLAPALIPITNILNIFNVVTSLLLSLKGCLKIQILARCYIQLLWKLQAVNRPLETRGDNLGDILGDLGTVRCFVSILSREVDEELWSPRDGADWFSLSLSLACLSVDVSLGLLSAVTALSLLDRRLSLALLLPSGLADLLFFSYLLTAVSLHCFDVFRIMLQNYSKTAAWPLACK